MIIIIRIYHHNTIQNISKTGLVYFNELNQTVFIDFAECRKNWVNYVSDEGDINLKPEETVCVGWRDAFDYPIYIEFFTEPKTRFIYPYRRSLIEWLRNSHGMKAYKHFRKTCIELEENGWVTFDLG